MGLSLADLPTLAEVQATRRVQQKHAEPSRLETKDAARKLDERKLDRWRKEVGKRDHWCDRFTGQPVERTIELKPNRGECHHHEPRENRDTRYDIRNGILLALSTHERIKLGTLKIVPTKGSRWFVVNSRRYLNVGGKVKFLEITP